MSLFELLVVFIVGLFLIKPEDFPEIFKKIKSTRKYFAKIKLDFLAYFDEELAKDTKIIHDDFKQINFYLERIANLGASYEGEYSLDKIRDYYKKLPKNN